MYLVCPKCGTVRPRRRSRPYSCASCYKRERILVSMLPQAEDRQPEVRMRAGLAQLRRGSRLDGQTAARPFS